MKNTLQSNVTLYKTLKHNIFIVNQVTMAFPCVHTISKPFNGDSFLDLNIAFTKSCNNHLRSKIQPERQYE